MVVNTDSPEKNTHSKMSQSANPTEDDQNHQEAPEVVKFSPEEEAVRHHLMQNHGR